MEHREGLKKRYGVGMWENRGRGVDENKGRGLRIGDFNWVREV